MFMTNQELKRAIVAIMLGAIVSILTKLAEVYIGTPIDVPNAVAGGVATGITYLKLTKEIYL